MLRPDPIACPVPARAFTSELSLRMERHETIAIRPSLTDVGLLMDGEHKLSPPDSVGYH